MQQSNSKNEKKRKNFFFRFVYLYKLERYVS